ncbi:MAG: type III polyketide synthase [Chitinophagales bacterium]
MSKPQSAVVSIGTAVPPFRYEQKTIADFMIGYFGVDAETSRKLAGIYSRTGIAVRHAVLPDFHMNGSSVLFKSPDINPSLSDRMDIYKKEAITLAARAVNDCFSRLSKKTRKKILPVTHLITVSCTGMSAPGLDLELMKELNLSSDTQRTSVNFMGCYAGFHAFKMADHICSSVNDATVLVVLAELCSIHFQPGIDSETMVVNSLFSDGAAALLFTSSQKARKGNERILEVIGFSSEVIHEGSAYMTWNASEKGFLMGLDALVPRLIEENAGPMVSESLSKFKLSREEISHWIFHPGGKRILEAAGKSIGLSLRDLKYSYRVLRDFGNMSSPTICFALQSLLQNGIEGKKREYIFAAGFGPGITIETALFKPVLND